MTVTSPSQSPATHDRLNATAAVRAALAKPLAPYYLVLGSTVMLTASRSGHGALRVERRVVRRERLVVGRRPASGDLGRHGHPGAVPGQSAPDRLVPAPGCPGPGGLGRAPGPGPRARDRGERQRQPELDRGRRLPSAAGRGGEVRARPLGRGPAHPQATAAAPARVTCSSRCSPWRRSSSDWCCSAATSARP